MARMGIIACQIFENELAQIFNDKGDDAKILLKRTPENRKFSTLLHSDALMYNDISMLSTLANDNETIIEILPAALHTDISQLEDACYDAVTSLKERCCVILLLYGLCGNALSHVISRKDVDIVTLNDDGIVDDCFVALLGRDRYMHQLRRGGSFFMSDGWIEHWDTIKTLLAGGEEGVKMLFSINKYERLLHITGLEHTDHLKDECMTIAYRHNIGYEYTKCDLDIIKDGIDEAYTRLKTKKHNNKSIRI